MIDGVDNRLEPVSLLTASMIMPNTASLLCPASPIRPPLRPSSDCAATLRACSSTESSSPLLLRVPAAAAANGTMPGEAPLYCVAINGTVPLRPANSSCTPRRLAAVSEISTTIASTSTCSRCTSS